jgi:hypothetical protein
MAEIVTVRLIALDDKFFNRTKLGTIGGTIYFQIDDSQFFPEKGWTDMPLAVSRDWLSVLLQIAEGATIKDRARFFDGDLAVDVSARGTDVVLLDFLHDEKIKTSVVAKAPGLLENAVSVTEELVVRCRQRGWNNGDTEALPSLIKRALRRLAISKSGEMRG